MPFSVPSLTRQNAFYVVDQSKSPLDPSKICEICFYSIDNSDELLRPCKCRTHNRPALFAHSDCFIQWLKANGYPKYCSKCKLKYTIVISPPIPFKRIFIMSIILIFLYYFLVHLKTCTTIQVMTKHQIQAISGGESVYKNIPEQLVLPRISKSCICNSYQSFTNHFISFSYLLFITLTAILSSFLITHFV